jgi:hypothetical protein
VCMSYLLKWQFAEPRVVQKEVAASNQEVLYHLYPAEMPADLMYEYLVPMEHTIYILVHLDRIHTYILVISYEGY